MAEHTTITVNGIKHQFTLEKGETLLEILRERLDLTGAKEGCGYGQCGTCTVVMNGEAVTACTIRSAKLADAEILTIEALAGETGLHPIQQAFVDAGAIQCGFCTPGYVLRLYALYTKSPEAGDDEIREALSHHLCRCTGYETIFAGAKLAQEYLKKVSS